MISSTPTLTIFLHVDKHADKAAGNESLLGKLFDQQQEIIKLLSQIIQPNTVSPPGNPISPQIHSITNQFNPTTG